MLVVRGAVNGVTSLLHPDSQIILPIGSSSVLVYSWTTDSNIIEDGDFLPGHQVRPLNADYFHGSQCPHLYGRDEELLKRSRLRVIQMSNNGYTASLSWVLTAVLGLVLPSSGAVSPAVDSPPASAPPSRSITSSPTASSASLCRLRAAFSFRS